MGNGSVSASGVFSSDPVSYGLRCLFEVLVLFALCGIVCAFGIVANVTNIVVFVKQGFKDSINISLLGLAVADLACVATQFWSSFCDNPLMDSPDMPFCSFHVIYYTTAWSHVCFNRITSFITAFITLERCLCIALPLKIKKIINASRTKLVIVSIFVVMFVVFSPFYYVNRLQWSYDAILNKTLLRLTYTQDRVLVETVTFLIHSVAMSAVSLISVVVCTGILIFKLREKTEWREMSAAKTLKMKRTTNKDTRVVKMVATIAVIFIICFLPGTVNFLVMAYDPEFSVTGKYQNLFFAIWAVTIFVESVSSSVNIFIYISMSSKFKATFWQLFCRHQIDLVSGRCFLNSLCTC